jgi:hypothetical protein
VIRLVTDKANGGMNPALSVEAALDRIARAEAMPHFTFLHSPESPRQAGNKRAPRTIVFDSEMAMTFGGAHSGAVGEDDLELMEFRPKTGRILLRFIRFPNAKNKLTAPYVSEVNPTQCTSCHTSDPMPFWSEYPNWPAAYGANDDQIVEDSAESKDLQSLRNAIRVGKYRPNLLRIAQNRGERADLRNSKLWFDPAEAYAPYSLRYKSERYDLRPNLFLGKLLIQHQAHRVARRIQASAMYRKYRSILVAKLAQCEWDVDLSPLYESVNAELAKDLHVKSAAEQGFIVELPKLLKVLGISLDEFSMSFKDKGSSKFRDNFDGRGYLSGYVVSHLYLGLTNEFPELKKYYGAESQALKGELQDPLSRKINALGKTAVYIGGSDPDRGGPVVINTLARSCSTLVDIAKRTFKKTSAARR